MENEQEKKILKNTTWFTLITHVHPYLKYLYFHVDVDVDDDYSSSSYLFTFFLSIRHFLCNNLTVNIHMYILSLYIRTYIHLNIIPIINKQV